MSPKKNRTTFRNHLLTIMSPEDRALLQPHLEQLALPRSKTLESPRKKIENVYFPEAGVLSVVGGAGNRETEIGIIGNEGVTGLPIIMGDDRSAHPCVVQIAGEGYRLPAAAFRDAINRSPSLHRLLLKYVLAFGTQTSHTGIANARGTLGERLCRWIVMAQDRCRSDELPLTHEFLSLMLAVRRPGVTEALHALAQNGLIRHHRGLIFVLDRNGLIEGTNNLYGTPESEYRRLLG